MTRSPLTSREQLFAGGSALGAGVLPLDATWTLPGLNPLPIPREFLALGSACAHRPSPEQPGSRGAASPCVVC